MMLVCPRSRDPYGLYGFSSLPVQLQKIKRSWMVLSAALALALCSFVWAEVDAASSPKDAGVFGAAGTAVVIDAGSTGSRLYVYTYTYEPSSESGVPQGRLKVNMPAVATKRISPGIAAFAEQVFIESESGEPIDEIPEDGGEALTWAQAESAVSGEQFHSDVASSDTFAHYMHRLRRVALSTLPDRAAQRRALLVFRGTAGMRALPEDQQEALLRAVCNNLKKWGLRYLPGKSCGVLSGHEEGALGWLALNQLLGRMPEEMSMVNFKQRQQQFQGGGSGAMIEMGGASVQVVFELPQSAIEGTSDLSEALSQPEADAGSFLLPVKGHKDLKILKVYGKPILLFTKSYLGLGRQLALVRVAAQSLRKHYDLHASHLEEKFCPSPSATSLHNQAAISLPSSPLYEAPLPCFPQDVTLSIDLQSRHFVIDEFLHDDVDPVKATPAGKRQKCLIEEEEPRKEVSWDLLTSQLDSEAIKELAAKEAEKLRNKQHTRARGVANFEGCQRDISSSWAEDERLPFDLPKDMQLYGTENFFHFNEYVVQAELRPKFSISTFRQAAEHICALPKIRDVLSKIHPSAAAEKAQTGCFGLVLMSQFLEDVLRLDKHRELLAVNEINGVEVSWTAGILFVMLPEVLAGDQLTEAVSVHHEEL